MGRKEVKDESLGMGVMAAVFQIVGKIPERRELLKRQVRIGASSKAHILRKQLGMESAPEEKVGLTEARAF